MRPRSKSAAAEDGFTRLGVQGRHGGRRRGDRCGLSTREVEVLRLLAAGNSNREIAAALVISEHTMLAPPPEHLRQASGVLADGRRALAYEHDLA